MRLFVRAALHRVSRRQQLEALSLHSRSLISQLDSHYSLLTPAVTKVVDLGYAPGNWLRYAHAKLLCEHGVEPEKAYRECNIVGVDLLFDQPPPGAAAIQGNIYSEAAHGNIVLQLKEWALQKMSGFSGDRAAWLPLLTHQDYQADVILSDLSSPFLQQAGFSNTHTKPYMRSVTNQALAEVVTQPDAASLDLADAALVLCCGALALRGTFVARLAHVAPHHPELELLMSRMDRVFDNVELWTRTDTVVVGTGKKRTHIDRRAVFA